MCALKKPCAGLIERGKNILLKLYFVNKLFKLTRTTTRWRAPSGHSTSRGSSTAQTPLLGTKYQLVTKKKRVVKNENKAFIVHLSKITGIASLLMTIF